MKQIHRPWTDEQVQFLRDNAATMTDLEIGTILGRTRFCVKNKRQALGISAENPWSEEEYLFLDTNIRKSLDWLTEQMGRPKWQIDRIRKTRPGYPQREYADKKDYLEFEAFLKENIDTMTWKQLGEPMGLSPTLAKSVARQFGLAKKKPETADRAYALQFVKEHLDDMTYREMAEATGISKDILAAVASQNGLSKTKDLAAETRKERDKKLIPIILEHYAELGYRGCAKLAGTNEKIIKGCAVRHNLQLPERKK